MQTLESPRQRSRKAGQQRRKQVGRSGHAHWKHGHARRSAFDILRTAEHNRVPHLIALKYQRMALSPFSYFRGAAPVMAHDIGSEPDTGIVCQLCGDAHVQNLGSFSAPDGSLVFDINDLDETLAGPFEWDVKRMAASIHLTVRAAKQSEHDCRNAVRAFLHRYAKSIAVFASMPIVDVAHYQVHRRTEVATMQSVFTLAERSTPLHLRDTLTQPAATSTNHRKRKGTHAPEAQPRLFRSDPPLLTRLSPAEAAPVLNALAPYMEGLQPERRHLLSRYRPVDVAFKVVGTGSVGLRDYVVYLEGNGPDDPLFLQIKQEIASAWASYAPNAPDSAVSPGERVVNGQRAMQIQSDPFLGYTHMDGRDYLVRQLNDRKASLNTEVLGKAALLHYSNLCGELLARGHARSGDPNELAGYIGSGTRFEKAIADFAASYADQTEADWKELTKLMPNLRNQSS